MQRVRGEVILSIFTLVIECRTEERKRARACTNTYTCRAHPKSQMLEKDEYIEYAEEQIEKGLVIERKVVNVYATV